jgi:ABC-2 type transport system ATP-binding protein
MLELDGVTRSFDGRRVLHGISFEVRPGRLTGFVGANGAGKTTTMRIILGVLGAEAGHVRLRGQDVTTEDRRTFGYMPEERGLYPKMRIGEQLVYLARLHGLELDDARGRTIDLLERFGLGDRSGDKLETLSLGNQQRVQVAAALVHRPSLLVLDEPFSGLDPVAVDSMSTLLRSHATAEVPVLFSSHQLDLVERICDDLVIIANGAVAATGTVEELRMKHAGARYRIVLDDDAGWLRDERGFTVLDVDGPRALLELPDPGADQELLRSALRRGAVHEFARVIPALSDIYREVAR